MLQVYASITLVVLVTIYSYYWVFYKDDDKE